MPHPILFIIDQLLMLYVWVVIIQVVLSWLVHFQIVNRYQPFVRKAGEVLYRITEPVLGRIRRYMPSLGGVDISPIILFLGINFVRYSLQYYFW